MTQQLKTPHISSSLKREGGDEGKNDTRERKDCNSQTHRVSRVLQKKKWVVEGGGSEL